MKLSKETLSIFKNFSNINTNLTINPGNKLTTISAGKNIIAEAVITESFPCDFGIYDLNEFLGAMSLFNDPELEFEDRCVLIKEDRNNIRYYSAAPGILTPVPTIKQFPESDIDFTLSSHMISQIQRVASILKVTDFSIIGNYDIISVSVGDKANSTANSFNSEIGTTDKTFKINFKVENLRLIPDDYKVSIGAKKIARFQSNSKQLTYFVATELDSTFEF